MPFQSKAQQRYMFAAEARGELPEGTAEEWAQATKKQPGGFAKLPEKVTKKKKKSASTAVAEFLKEANTSCRRSGLFGLFQPEMIKIALGIPAFTPANFGKMPTPAATTAPAIKPNMPASGLKPPVGGLGKSPNLSSVASPPAMTHPVPLQTWAQSPGLPPAPASATTPFQSNSLTPPIAAVAHPGPVVPASPTPPVARSGASAPSPVTNPAAFQPGSGYPNVNAITGGARNTLNTPRLSAVPQSPLPELPKPPQPINLPAPGAAPQTGTFPTQSLAAETPAGQIPQLQSAPQPFAAGYDVVGAPSSAPVPAPSDSQYDTPVETENTVSALSHFNAPTRTGEGFRTAAPAAVSSIPQSSVGAPSAETIARLTRPNTNINDNPIPELSTVSISPEQETKQLADLKNQGKAVENLTANLQGIQSKRQQVEAMEPGAARDDARKGLIAEGNRAWRSGSLENRQRDDYLATRQAARQRLVNQNTGIGGYGGMGGMSNEAAARQQEVINPLLAQHRAQQSRNNMTSSQRAYVDNHEAIMANRRKAEEASTQLSPAVAARKAEIQKRIAQGQPGQRYVSQRKSNIAPSLGYSGGGVNSQGQRVAIKPAPAAPKPATEQYEYGKTAEDKNEKALTLLQSLIPILALGAGGAGYGALQAPGNSRLRGALIGGLGGAGAGVGFSAGHHFMHSSYGKPMAGSAPLSAGAMLGGAAVGTHGGLNLGRHIAEKLGLGSKRDTVDNDLEEMDVLNNRGPVPYYLGDFVRTKRATCLSQNPPSRCPVSQPSSVMVSKGKNGTKRVSIIQNTAKKPISLSKQSSVLSVLSFGL